MPKIAIVDDDAGLRGMVNSFLLSLGYDVDSFGSGEELLEWLEANEAACIITDVAPIREKSVIGDSVRQ